MINVNSAMGADVILLECAKLLIERIKDKPLIGCELGIAYGGGVEAIGKLWKDVGGTIYGFDTFEGMPKQLANSPMEANAMDGWYQAHGTEALGYDYQRKILDEQNLTNVILRKGLINSESLKDIPYLHYALLDLDLIVSMALGWTLVRPLMQQRGFLCLHDVIPEPGGFEGLWKLYQEILATGEYKLIAEYPSAYLAVLEKQ